MSLRCPEKDRALFFSLLFPPFIISSKQTHKVKGEKIQDEEKRTKNTNPDKTVPLLLKAITGILASR